MKKSMQLFLLFLLSLLTGCTDQRDLYVDTYSLLLVKKDWIPARIETDKGSTITIYPQRQVELLENPWRKKLSLAEGDYDILVFNRYLFSETDNNFDHIFYRNTQDFLTFEACATEIAPASRFRSLPGEVIVNYPDTLATRSNYHPVLGERKFVLKYKNGVHATPAISEHIADSIEFVPCRVTHLCDVYVHAQNAHLISQGGIVRGTLRGFAGSVFMAQRMPGHTAVSHQFIMSRLTYTSGSTTDGTLHTVFSTFGPPLDLPDRRYELQLYVRYPSGGEQEFLFDVTDQLTPQIERLNADRLMNKPIMDNIEVHVKVELERPPGGGDDSDWGVGLEDWGNVIVSVPVVLK